MRTTPSPATGTPLPCNLADYEALARGRLDAAVWDFIQGGSEDEVTLAANTAAFRRVVLRPRALAGVRAVDLGCTLLGVPLPHPVLIAPMGYLGLAHPEGECAAARAAAATGSLMVVGTMSNHSLEEVAATAAGPRWFQLYALKDRALTQALIERAEAAGYQALVLTVDTPRMGRRERDLRNGFAPPPHLRPVNLLGAESASDAHRGRPGSSAVARQVLDLFDSTLDWSVLDWLRARTRLPIVLKGILLAEDAARAVAAGVDGIIVSNHGGRQLDGAPAAIDALAEVAEAVDGRCEVLLDGGVRRGSDALKARALGARAILIGRPVLWGLAARGEEGVRHVIELLRAEIEHAMLLAGRASWMEIDRSLVARR